MRSESAARETVNCMRASPMGSSGFARIVLPVATQYRMPKLYEPPRIFPAAVSRHRSARRCRSTGLTTRSGEISERGLRLNCSGEQFPLAERIQGTLALTAGMRCTVTGTVLRVEDSCVIVKLSRGPTGYDVMREQRHLSQDLPGLEAPARLKWGQSPFLANGD